MSVWEDTPPEYWEGGHRWYRVGGGGYCLSGETDRLNWEGVVGGTG